MATAQKSSKKQLAAPHRASDRGTALTGRDAYSTSRSAPAWLETVDRVSG
jgi:hypothetical protein